MLGSTPQSKGKTIWYYITLVTPYLGQTVRKGNDKERKRKLYLILSHHFGGSTVVPNHEKYEGGNGTPGEFSDIYPI